MRLGLLRSASVVAFAALVGFMAAEPGSASVPGRSELSAEIQTAVVQSGSTPPQVVSRGWLGANFRVYEDESHNEIILVAETLPDGPAFIGGIRQGDHVVRVNGVPATGELFASVASRLVAGDPIAFTIRRGASTVEIALRAGERPDEATLRPRLVQIELDSAQAGFETRLRLIEQARGEGGVFFSAPHVRMVESDGQMQIVTELQVSDEPGRFQIRSGNGQPVSFELRFPDPDEARPLMAWIEADSLAGARVGERGIWERRLLELVTQVKNVQRSGSGGNTAQRNQTLVELERSLRETEARIGAPRTSPGNSLTLIEPLGDDVLFTSRQGVTLVPRPLAPYVTGRNRVAGAELREMNRDLAEYFQVDSGLLVTDVAEGSPAETAGLLSGDVLRSVNGTVVATVDQFREIMSRPVSGRTIDVIRRGATVRLQLR